LIKRKEEKMKFLLAPLTGCLLVVFILSGCATKSEAVREEEVAEEKTVEKKVEKKEEKKEVKKEEVKEVEQHRIDSDGDGVYDSEDRCPDTPAGVKVDAAGCPEYVGEEADFTFAIEFDIDSATVKSVYYKQGEEIAQFMSEHPEAELIKVVIEGHADSTGSDEYNLALSKQRADSVRRVLIRELDIDPAKIEVYAYGEKRPIANNDTESGRRKNRRAVITFSVVNIMSE
jgi:OOP family OmpA-OmpF porin